MGLFSGGLTFGSFFVYQIVGLIFGWANFQVGLLSGVYGIPYTWKHIFIETKKVLYAPIISFILRFIKFKSSIYILSFQSSGNLKL